MQYIKSSRSGKNIAQRKPKLACASQSLTKRCGASCVMACKNALLFCIGELLLHLVTGHFSG